MRSVLIHTRLVFGFGVSTTIVGLPLAQAPWGFLTATGAAFFGAALLGLLLSAATRRGGPLRLPCLLTCGLRGLDVEKYRDRVYAVGRFRAANFDILIGC